MTCYIAVISMSMLGTLILPVQAETWDCTYTIMSRADKGISDKSRIEISGKILNWLSPPPPGNQGWTKVPYEVIDNNDSGIVSIMHGSRIDPQAGPIIGASIIALNKATGDLRVGSVTVDGVDDRLGGRCQRK
jgi:hypothetical protein